MAIQISRAFKDISLSFSRNPITNDIIALQNENAIKKSVMNLVRTRIGERFFNNLIGSNVDNTLFELNLEEITETLNEDTPVLLDNYEPRIRFQELQIENLDDTNELNVRIVYDIVGLPFPTQNIEFILQPSRL